MWRCSIPPFLQFLLQLWPRINECCNTFALLSAFPFLVFFVVCARDPSGTTLRFVAQHSYSRSHFIDNVKRNEKKGRKKELRRMWPPLLYKKNIHCIFPQFLKILNSSFEGVERRRIIHSLGWPVSHVIRIHVAKRVAHIYLSPLNRFYLYQDE